LKHPGDLSIWFVYAVWLEKGFWLNLLQNGFLQVMRETFEEEDDIVMIFEMKTWMASHIYGTSHKEWWET
jgi:hypothetical protein